MTRCFYHARHMLADYFVGASTVGGGCRGCQPSSTIVVFVFSKQCSEILD